MLVAGASLFVCVLLLGGRAAVADEASAADVCESALLQLPQLPGQAPPPPLELAQESVEAGRASTMFQGYAAGIAQSRPQIAVRGATSPPAARARADITILTSMSEIVEELDLSAQVSFSAAGVGSGSAKATFLNRMRVASTSVTVLVRLIRGSTTEAVSVQLKEGMAAPASDEDLQRWYTLYGDSYVSEVTTGAEYFGAYIFESESSEQQRRVETEVSGTANFASGTAITAELSATIDRVARETRTRVRFVQEAFGLENLQIGMPMQDNGNGLIGFAQEFFRVVVQSPAVLSFRMEGYETVRGVGPAFAAIATNRRLLEGQALGSLGGLRAEEAASAALQEQARQLLSLYHDWKSDFQDAGLRGVETRAGEDIQAIARLRTAYDVNPATPLQAPRLRTSGASIEPAPPTFDSLGEVGGNGGRPFRHPNNVQNVFDTQWRLVRIEVRAANRVDQLCGIFFSTGNRENVRCNGGRGGSPQRSLSLAPGQWVNRVEIWSTGSRINGLRFRRNDGTRTPIYGRDRGDRTEQNMGRNCVFIGMRGRSGDELDAFEATEMCLRTARIRGLQ